MAALEARLGSRGIRAQAIADDGRSLAGEKGALLAKESARRMTTPVLGDVGLGLFRETHEGEIYFGHNGSDEGFQAILIASREGGVES